MSNPLTHWLPKKRKQEARCDRASLSLENLERRDVMAAGLAAGTEPAFVQELYHDVLGRTASPQEVSGWVSNLQNGMSAEGVANAFLTSSEHLTTRVDALYREALNRPADAGGLQAHLVILQNGGTEHDVLKSLLGSAEYNARHAGDADFVASLYQNVLHRTQSQPELDSYVSLLSTGQSRSSIIQGFLSSTERATVEVEGLYQGYLGHHADPGSLASFTNALTSGSHTLNQLSVNILVSPENQSQALTPHATASAAPSAGGAVFAAPPDRTAPFLTGATSVGNTTVRVTFSEDMADSALNLTAYQITQNGTALPVTATKFLGGRRTVELTTAEQDEVTYTVAVSGTTDLAGNAVTGATVNFAGTPNPRDTDGDGLTDQRERRGWDIKVTALDGIVTTTRVTSDPTKADTDTDGLTDPQEVTGRVVTVTKADGTTATRSVISDPTKTDTDGDGFIDTIERNLGLDPSAVDTDADGVTDFAELAGRRVTVTAADGTTTAYDVTSNPLKADTDADGLTDGQEATAGSDPTKADTDADDLNDAGEVAGWNVTVTKVNGTTATRAVTSDPTRADTDGDKLTDRHELTLVSDPRSTDTDADSLTDYSEVTEIHSSPIKQDTDGDGVDDGTEFNILHTPVNAAPPTPDQTAPGVAGAVALANTRVLVSFSEALSDTAINPANYFITQTNVNTEAGTLRVLSARFIGGDRTIVELTTASQGELNYTVTAVNLKDFAGNVLAPHRGTFAGKPPVGTEIVDSDGDTIPDHVEQRGWTVAVTLVDGRIETRQVTSDPYTADTDGDGLRDDREMTLSLDPRNADTDADALTDRAEVETIVSNPTRRDTDGDGKDDGTEFAAGGSAAVTTSTVSTDTTQPRVVGAASLSNGKIRISFSEPMSDAAADTANFFVFQVNVNPEVGFLPLTGASFVPGTNNMAIDLTTASQNEVTYSITAINMTDRAGNALAPRMVIAGAVVDPTTATFPGTPPSGSQFVDTDGDGLSDNVEQRGWVVAITLLDGRIEERQATSDPTNPDTDGDGLGDAQERNLAIDARNADTDGDQINDYSEFNELFSDPTKQDTDGDKLDDYLELNFFRTSPIYADTDGDQISDGNEILTSLRNPRVADLPAPDLAIGEMNLQLDVRFTEITAEGRRELDSKTVSASLQQSNSTEFSHTDAATHEFSVEIGQEQKINLGTKESSIEFGYSQQFGYTGGFSTSATATSAQETQRQYQDSLQTDVETTENGSVERQVVGARMQVALTLKSVGTIAFRAQNLLVTAFLQDPENPTVLRPLASLRPDFEPDGGFVVGPLVPERGPIVFASDTVFPALIESLMQNPRGVVFRLANYDIVDELGRNFAFTSQDIVERTGAVVFDFGGADTNKDGDGDLTEYHRVSTGTGRIIDGKRIAFDSSGNPVGVTLADAMSAIGLTRYEARRNPSTGVVREYEPGGTVPVTLTRDQLRTSYSVIVDARGVERPHRIREVSNQLGTSWVVLRPTGEIDANVGFNDKILRAGADIRLAYVQDLDGDNLPATLEYLLGTVDSSTDAFNNTTWAAGADGIPDSRDTDEDGLDDRIESLVGWTVDLGGGITRHVTSSGYNDDTDEDGLSDAFEAPALSAFVDDNGDGLLDRYDPTRRAAGDHVTDPSNPDTDGDGVARYIVIDPTSGVARPSDDFAEVNGYTIERIYTGGGFIQNVKTDPTRADTDGDQIADGVEARFGLDPRDPGDKDSDKDGLPDYVEIFGGTAALAYDVSTSPKVQGTSHVGIFTSNPFDADTDDDGLSDFVEFELKTNSRSKDTDNDGLTDFQEVQGVVIRDLGVVKLNPLDADVDNDMRSDGDEAELVDVESKRWVVNPAGKTPYRVYSDPRFADADFDGLVDGEEFADFDGNGTVDTGYYRTDPSNGNTDGDKRSDGVEYRKSNPLVEDFTVTVFFNSLTITDDGDWDRGDKDGDFGLDLGVRLPGTGVGGLGTYASVVHDTVTLTAPYQVGLALGDHTVENALPVHTGGGDPFALEQNNLSRGIAFDGANGGTALQFARYLSTSSRAITFGMAANESFSVEGIIAELDLIGGAPENSSANSDYHIYYTYVGGVDGLRATQAGAQPDANGNPPPTIRPVFRGSDLLAQNSAFVDYTIVFKGTDDLQAGAGQGDTDTFGGSLSFSIFVG